MSNPRDDLISALADLIAGLHVPVSLGMPLGTATKAYSKARDQLNDFGWSSADDIEAKLRKVLLP